MIHLRQSIKRVFRKSRVVGCVLVIGEDGKLKADLCITEKKRDVLKTTAIHKDLSLLQVKGVAGDSPLIISVASETIIHKKINKRKEEDWRTVATIIIPKLKTSDFFIQYYALDEHNGYISFARISEVGSIIKNLSDHGLVIYDFVLGPFVLNATLRFLNASVTRLRTRYFLIDISEKAIDNFSTEFTVDPDDVLLAGQSFSGDIIIQYSSCITFYTGGEPLCETVNGDILSEARQKFLKKKLEKKIVTSCLAGIIVFWALSLSLYRYGKQQLDTAHREYLTQIKSFEGDEKISERLSTIRGIVNGLNWDPYKYASYFCDQIAMSIPDKIVLKEIRTFPEVVPQNKKKHLSFDTSLILISGECTSTESLASWLKNIEGFHWSDGIRNQVYHWNQQKGKGVFSFEIKIH